MDDAAWKEYRDFVRAWALKKMKKQEKKLKHYAQLYFGEPVAIVYARKGAVIVHRNGEESMISVSEE